MTCTNAQITKIRTVLAKLPDDKYRRRGLTHDQLELWICQRVEYEIVSRCWEALHKGLNNPLPKLVEEKLIAPFDSKICGLLTERYQYLWQLIFLSEAYVKEVSACLGMSYPFNSALDLFRHIVQEQSARGFKRCLEPYVEIPASESEAQLRKDVKTLRAGLPKLPMQQLSMQPNASQVNDLLNGLKAKFGSRFWTTYAWCVWDVLAQYRRDIKRNVTAYDDVTAEIARLSAGKLRRTKSIAWKNGHKGVGQRGGYYHFPDSSARQTDVFSDLDFNQEIISQICNIP